MSGVDPTTLLLQLGVLLCVAFVLGRAAERVGLPATTGELAAGLVLGPSLLGGVFATQEREWLFDPSPEQLASVRGIALFCGVLLIGVAGATVDLEFVRTQTRTISIISLGALGLPLVSTFLLTLGVDPRLRGAAANQWSFAVFAGLALSVSAVPVMVKIFADLGVLNRRLSQLSLSVAVIDDATVWVGLSAVAGYVHLRRTGGPAVLGDDVLVVATAVAALAVLTALARLASGVDRSAGRRDVGTSTWCLVAATFITLGAVVTAGCGLDSTLGAFLCGMVVATGAVVPTAALRPLRTVVLGVLAPLFLAVNGLSADLTSLRNPRLLALAGGAVLLAVASKTFGAYVGGRLAGLEHRAASTVASALNARGTVQLVVAAAGLRLGLITTEGFTILVLVALVTSAMAGPLIRRNFRRLPATPDDHRREPLTD